MNKKKMSKLIVILSILALYTVSTFGASFKDVPQTHWAYASIIDMQKRGVMLPGSSGEFFPNRVMNYFEAADVLAKATGYVDVNTNTSIDDTFKKQIINNYETQKPILTAYENKSKGWDKLYNQQIAYLLGRGYLKKEELNKFITQGSNQKAVMDKQELPILLVRILGKEETAKTTYKVSGFNDDNFITAVNKPYIAYLQSIGIITKDAKALFNPKTPLTRALCAKMLSETLTYKEKKAGTTTPAQTNTATDVNAQNIATVKRIVPKNDTEYYIQLEKNSNTSFYTIQKTTKVIDAVGNEVAIAAIPIESKAAVVITQQNNTDYITSMKLQGAAAAQTTANQVPVDSSSTIVNGKIATIGTNGAISILLSDDSTKTYLVDTSCIVRIDGESALLRNVREDDTVKATIQLNLITRLEVQTTTGLNNSTSSLTEGEVTAKAMKIEGYALTVKQGTKTSELIIGKRATLKRNNKTAEWDDIRIGDKVKTVKENGEITELIVTGTRSSIEGKVKGIYVATISEVTLTTKNGTETFAINETTEIYDNNKRENVSLREVRLGQNVEILVESKEVISLVIQRNNTSIKYKAKIEYIDRNNEYIDVLVDYDPLSDASKVMKRVKTPVRLEIELDGKQEHRSSFKVGMDLLITYKYLDDAIPEKILILE